MQTGRVAKRSGADLKESPIALVDVDGVLSLFGFDTLAPPPGSFASVDGLPHWLARDAGALVDRLAATFECVWCTGWEDRAPEHLPHLLGLTCGPFPHIGFDDHEPGPRAHWKLAAIDAYVGADRAVAWIDDAHDERTAAWAADRPGPTLLMTTDPAVGLNLEQVMELERWARDRSGRVPSGAP